MKTKSSLRCAALILSLFAFSSVNAELIALEYGSTVDHLNQEVTFFINFNKTPDFFTTDSVGRQAASFQFYIDADGLDPTPGRDAAASTVESIVRGEEIHVAGDLRIRDRYNYDGTDPNSGGWGPILGIVPYSRLGTIVSFTTPWSFLKDDDGVFTYQLLVLEYGGGLSDFSIEYGVSGKSYSPNNVPIPSTVWLTISGLLSLLAVRTKQSNRRGRDQGAPGAQGFAPTGQ